MILNPIRNIRFPGSGMAFRNLGISAPRVPRGGNWAIE